MYVMKKEHSRALSMLLAVLLVFSMMGSALMMPVRVFAAAQELTGDTTSENIDIVKDVKLAPLVDQSSDEEITVSDFAEISVGNATVLTNTDMTCYNVPVTITADEIPTHRGLNDEHGDWSWIGIAIPELSPEPTYYQYSGTGATLADMTKDGSDTIANTYTEASKDYVTFYWAFYYSGDKNVGVLEELSGGNYVNYQITINYTLPADYDLSVDDGTLEVTSDNSSDSLTLSDLVDVLNAHGAVITPSDDSLSLSFTASDLPKGVSLDDGVLTATYAQLTDDSFTTVEITVDLLSSDNETITSDTLSVEITKSNDSSSEEPSEPSTGKYELSADKNITIDLSGADEPIVETYKVQIVSGDSIVKDGISPDRVAISGSISEDYLKVEATASGYKLTVSPDEAVSLTGKYTITIEYTTDATYSDLSPFNVSLEITDSSASSGQPDPTPPATTYTYKVEVSPDTAALTLDDTIDELTLDVASRVTVTVTNNSGDEITYSDLGLTLSYSVTGSSVDVEVDKAGILTASGGAKGEAVVTVALMSGDDDPPLTSDTLTVTIYNNKTVNYTLEVTPDKAALTLDDSNDEVTLDVAEYVVVKDASDSNIIDEASYDELSLDVTYSVEGTDVSIDADGILTAYGEASGDVEVTVRLFEDGKAVVDAVDTLTVKITNNRTVQPTPPPVVTYDLSVDNKVQFDLAELTPPCTSDVMPVQVVSGDNFIADVTPTNITGLANVSFLTATPVSGGYTISLGAEATTGNYPIKVVYSSDDYGNLSADVMIEITDSSIEPDQPTPPTPKYELSVEEPETIDLSYANLPDTFGPYKVQIVSGDEIIVPNVKPTSVAPKANNAFLTASPDNNGYTITVTAEATTGNYPITIAYKDLSYGDLSTDVTLEITDSSVTPPPPPPPVGPTYKIELTPATAALTLDNDTPEATLNVAQRVVYKDASGDVLSAAEVSNLRLAARFSVNTDSSDVTINQGGILTVQGEFSGDIIVTAQMTQNSTLLTYDDAIATMKVHVANEKAGVDVEVVPEVDVEHMGTPGYTGDEDIKDQVLKSLNKAEMPGIKENSKIAALREKYKDDTDVEINVILDIVAEEFNFNNGMSKATLKLNITPKYEVVKDGELIEGEKLEDSDFTGGQEVVFPLPDIFKDIVTVKNALSVWHGSIAPENRLVRDIDNVAGEWVLSFTTNSFSPFLIGPDTEVVEIRYSDRSEIVDYVYGGDIGSYTFRNPVNDTDNGNPFQGWTRISGSRNVMYNAGDAINNTQFRALVDNGLTSITLYPIYAQSGGGTTPGGSTGSGSSSGAPSTVTRGTTANGTYTLSNSYAKAGDTVTITPRPNAGYEVDTVTVTDKNGNPVAVTMNADGTYSFVMPEASLLPVKTNVTFKPIGSAGSNGFTDVASDSWYANAVAWAVNAGVTKGTSATTFSPTQPCTRAQFVTFLWRAAGSPELSASENRFSDVSETAQADYYTAILWAVDQGITLGTGDGTTFSPNDAVTRGQAVTFMSRYAQKAGIATRTGSPAFSDVQNEGAVAAYYDSIGWAVANGITNGNSTTANTFGPMDSCTRAEMVTFLFRLFTDATA